MVARGKRRPAQKRRFLQAEAAKTMLTHALGPRFGYPMCEVLAASHAAGISAASFVARATQSNLIFLQNQVDVCCGEIFREHDFTPLKLREHMDLLLALNNSFAAVATVRDISPACQNMVAKAFMDLPQKLSSTYRRTVLRIDELLQDKILWPVITLVERIDQHVGSRNFEKEIRSLLQGHTKVHLAKIRERLVETRKQVADISKKTLGGWEYDLEQIAGRTGCKRVGA